MNIIRLPTTAATNANVSRSPYDFMIMIYSVSTPGFGLESTGLPSRKEGSPVFLLYKIIQNIRFRATVFNQSLQKSEYKKASLLSHNVFRHRLAPNRGGLRVVFTRDARSVQLHTADKQTTGGCNHPPVVISLEIGAF